MNINIFKINQDMKNKFDHAESRRSSSDSVVLRFEYKGIESIGESAPRAYVTGHTTDDVIAELKSINIINLIEDICVDGFVESICRLQSVQFAASPCTTCVLEMAILDWIGKKHNLPLWKILNFIQDSTEIFNEFQVTAVMDLSMSPSEFIKNRGPFHVVKIKITNDVYDNVERVSAIRKTLGEDIKIILDANMCWTIDSAEKHIQALKKYNILYYEEPLSKGSFENYQKLRTLFKCRVMLDESVCSFSDLEDAIHYKSCDAVNIRISKNGGLLSSLKMIKICRDNGIKYQIGSQVAEVGPLICAGRHLRSVNADVITYEGGQPDRWFSEYTIEPMPEVNRVRGIAHRIDSAGLGCISNRNLERLGKLYEY
ncbi:enolase C-terminal domain-like protein [Vibrio mangrovi]|uniref:Enolase C-terminal domain-like protein n=1 Tax=Vibrio mangrovi TaxID=474394 RepID=A0A1Y6IQA7_9VIBR|nr:enolase C-terminal domain-like protein [Vibrio mangrovi]MDW6003383.1 enolase C-terminal domain-like protein [Vibrio mangrovi]SMR99827.1 L-Ala-D/L-Glu epimerase [Vibrio mangrovi]